MASGCVNRPARFFILPDPVTPYCVSATSQAGPNPGPTTTTTAGKLVPIQSGDSITDDALSQYEYKLLTAGGVDGSEFAWRDPDGGTWNGSNDIRYWYGYENPLGNVENTNSMCLVYSKKHMKKFIIYEQTSTTVRAYYQSLDTAPYQTWSYFGHTLADINTSGHSLAACELDDGSILLIRRDSSGEFHAHRSSDPSSEPFTLVSENIIERTLGPGSAVASQSLCQIRVASSGNWVRLCFVGSVSADPLAYNVNTYVSSDRGATWNNLPSFLARSTGLTTDFVPFDLVGFDEAGSFLVALVQTGSAALDPSRPKQVVVGSANQDGEWTFSVTPGGYDPIETLPGLIYSLCVAKSDKYVWVFPYYYSAETVDPFDDMYEWSILRSEVSLLKGSNATLTASWESMGYPIYDNIATYFVPGRPFCAWSGDHLYFCIGRRNITSSGSISNAITGYRALGWTQKSVGRQGASIAIEDLNNTGWNYNWNAGMGEPTFASPLWTAVATGTAALYPYYLAASDYVRFGVTVPSWSGSTYYSVQGDSSVIGPEDWFTYGGCWRFVGKHVSGAATGSITVFCSDPNLTGRSATFTILFNATTVQLCTGGPLSTGRVTLETITLNASRPIFEVRLYASIATNQVRMSVYVPSTDTWFQTATYPVVILGSSTNNRLWIGLFGPATGPTIIEMRELQFTTDGTFMNQDKTFVSEYDLFGALTMAEPVHVNEGLQVGWAGSGGYQGDTWLGNISYTYPKEAVFVDSPRIGWRCPRLTNSIIARAGPPDATSDNYYTFVHNAVAVFGTNNRYLHLAYDDTEAFSTPTTTTVIDCTLFGGQTFTIASANRDTITLTGSTFPWSRGDLVGCYVESTGVAAYAAKITRHLANNVLQLDSINGDAVSYGFTVGSSVVIYAPYGFATFNQVNERYMRIRVPFWSSVSEGYYTIGTVVAGTKLDIDVPMDWAHTDDEQPNVTTYRTKSGISWAFAEGPVQRTIEGRVVGDAEEWRQKFRALLRQVNYEGKAVVLGADSDTNYKNIMLGRVKSGSSLDNAGYYIDSSGYLRPAGDMSLTFVEEK